ncbi:hypothetical protein [Actinomadura fibrosa]|uniref:Uncharacterized protein n=1 Tax=Actinomadura fibrosa TaxID=111802 RepID=A0ABW2XFE8_9ACTN|nr:hypothetical protein [Actinomadura fibrosa]
MTMIPGPFRRAAVEAEHRLRGGVGLLARLTRDLERTADLGRLLPSYGDRIRSLEEAVQERDAELDALRAELRSLVAQLNDRLLPGIDERMDDTERDLSAVAAGLVRTGRDGAEQRARLEAAERRLSDLRGKVAQMEQRAGLWRDLQASMARLGDDVDALRSRFALRAAEPVAEVVRAAEPVRGVEAVRSVVPEPVQPVASERVADRPA